MDNFSFPLSLLYTILALVLVIALAWLTIRFLASMHKGHLQGGNIKILQSVSLGSRERIVLAKVHNKEYVLGVTAGGISVIDQSESGATSTADAY